MLTGIHLEETVENKQVYVLLVSCMTILKACLRALQPHNNILTGVSFLCPKLTRIYKIKSDNQIPQLWSFEAGRRWQRQPSKSIGKISANLLTMHGEYPELTEILRNWENSEKHTQALSADFSLLDRTVCRLLWSPQTARLFAFLHNSHAQKLTELQYNLASWRRLFVQNRTSCFTLVLYTCTVQLSVVGDGEWPNAESRDTI